MILPIIGSLRTRRGYPDREANDIAIMIEPTAPGDLAPMLIHGYALSAREQEVVQHVPRGESTAPIATALFISPHTAQDISERSSTK